MSLADAQHEAAHVVVGVALGCRLLRATIANPSPGNVGEAHFASGPHEALLIMYAAGVAWERRFGDLADASGDLACLRELGVAGNARVRALERAAWAVLASRPGVHSRVTRALLEQDLTAAEITRMVRGGA